MPIEIFRVHADQIRAAAAEAHPYECCGLLLGRENHILGVIPSPNVGADPTRHFEIDPTLLLATHRRARQDGLELLGCYHSHPSSTLEPSSTDAANATGGMPYWLLASPSAITAWNWVQSGYFTAIDLMVID